MYLVALENIRYISFKRMNIITVFLCPLVMNLNITGLYEEVYIYTYIVIDWHERRS